MKQILLLTLLTLIFSSCKPILTNTFGRYQVNKMHNGGTVSNENYSVEVPFEIINGQIILKIYADKDSKDPLNFLFGTNSHSGVSLKKYEQFKGDFSNLRTENFDINKVATETEVYLVEELYIGDILVENFKLTVDEYVNKNLDGVIGADFMMDKVFTFDFPNNKLLISDISPEESTTDYRFRLKKDWRKVYSTKINIEGQLMKFVFDTGRTGFLEVTDKSEIIGDKQRSYELIGRDLDGYRSATVSYIQTRNLAFDNNLIDKAIIIRSSDYSNNTLGTKLLMENKVILDCIKLEMILKLENEKIKIDAIDYPTHSFAFGWMEGLKVVAKKVEAFAIDLELFDEIIEINSIKISDSREDTAHLLKRLKNEKIWFLKVRRGELEIDVQVPPVIVEF